MKGALLAAWGVELVLVTYKSVKAHRTVAGLPIPADYVGSFIIYGSLAALSTASPAAEQFATAMGWAVAIATGLNVIDPTFANGLKAGLSGKPLGGPTGPGTGSATNQAPGTTTAGGRG